MSHETEDTPVPELFVEQLALGELPPEGAADVEARLGERAADALDAIAASNRSILDTYPADAAAREFERLSRAVARDVPRAPPRRRWLWPAIGGLMAATLVLVIVSPGGVTEEVGATRDGDGAITRTKGLEPSLRIYRKGSGGDQHLLRADARVAGGDVLQLRYLAAGRRHGAIVSLDGRGEVTLHWPLAEGTAGSLEPGGEVGLPFAYKLDDAPGFERFFLVAGERPLRAEVVVAAARRLADRPDGGRSGALVLPGEGAFSQTSLLLLKRSAGVAP